MLADLIRWVLENDSFRLRIRPHPAEDRDAFRQGTEDSPRIELDPSTDLLESIREGVALCVSPFSRASLYAAGAGRPVW